MPALTELADLQTRANAASYVPPVDVLIDADARAAMNVSFDRTGLLLLGELHGVRQTPQVIAALVELLNVQTLAFEWPEQLAVAVDNYRCTGLLEDHELLWLGDGRLTAGHLALLRVLADREPAIDWLAFDSSASTPEIPGESPWTARDYAMAHRILDHTDSTRRTLVIAGNAHTPTTRTNNGLPMGAWLTRKRSGLRSVRINYAEGVIYNLGTMPHPSESHPTRYHLRMDGDHILLDHPSPAEADVPHRSAFPVLDKHTTSGQTRPQT